MTIVYCDCDDCYNNNDSTCELDAILLTGSRTGGGGLMVCDNYDYQEINREEGE